MPEQHGWDKEPEQDDPMELVGTSAPGQPAFMARCLVEEYARMGMNRKQVRAIFQNPFYQSAYQLYEEFGEETINQLIKEVFQGFENVTYDVSVAGPGAVESTDGEAQNDG